MSSDRGPTQWGASVRECRRRPAWQIVYICNLSEGAV
jgi:hypothetical protein